MIEPCLAQPIQHRLIDDRGAGAHVRIEPESPRFADQVNDVAADERLTAGQM